MLPVPTLTDADLAFGSIAHLPAWADIPEAFRRNSGAAYRWCEFVSTWFFAGTNTALLTPKPGVDKTAALRAVRGILGSFEPKHEHKIAGCAFLLSEWFEFAAPAAEAP
jgi:hypothetical protein